ncbi:16836_t:CDS:2, partial [Dentiscutata heterogama]
MQERGHRRGWKKNWKNEENQEKRHEPKKDITCYSCGEPGHISQFCLSEKAPKKESEDKNKANYVEVATSYIDNDGWEDEVYTLGENRYQPYEGNSKKVAQAQLEARWENQLRTRRNVTSPPLVNLKAPD